MSFNFPPEQESPLDLPRCVGFIIFGIFFVWMAVFRGLWPEVSYYMSDDLQTVTGYIKDSGGYYGTHLSKQYVMDPYGDKILELEDVDGEFRVGSLDPLPRYLSFPESELTFQYVTRLDQDNHEENYVLGMTIDGKVKFTPFGHLARHSIIWLLILFMGVGLIIGGVALARDRLQRRWGMY